MFSVLYAIKDQKSCLNILNSVDYDKSILVIFDYFLIDKLKEFKLTDLAGKSMYPINHDELYNFLKQSGWSLLEETDLTDNFVHWYEKFIDRMENQKNIVLEKFSLDAYETVKSLFQKLLKKLYDQELGGKVFYAVKSD